MIQHETQRHRKAAGIAEKTGSIDAYLQENKDFLLDCNIKEYLRALIREKGITIVQLASDAQLSERYCFQLLSLSNPRHPSRDVLLSMCIGMQLNLDETQTALRIAKTRPALSQRRTGQHSDLRHRTWKIGHGYQ